ncbi:MAG: hypothetical protein ACREJN_03790 [Nitrospiraceae bacterium]
MTLDDRRPLGMTIADALVSAHKPVKERSFTRVSGKRNTLMAVTSIDAMMYGGISIVVLIGVLAIGMGMVAGK